MNLLLTSGGLTNEKLVGTFKDIVGKPLGEVSVAMIITATLGEAGDKRWFLNDLQNLYNTGVGNVDLVDLAGQDDWRQRLEAADVIWGEGGNTKRLMHYIAVSGLQKRLPGLLKTRAYVGVSAGSMTLGVCAPANAEALVYDEVDDKYSHVDGYVELVDAVIMPHLNSEFFPRTPENIAAIAAQTKTPLYALDDNSALLVRGSTLQVVSSGDWKAYNV